MTLAEIAILWSLISEVGDNKSEQRTSALPLSASSSAQSPFHPLASNSSPSYFYIFSVSAAIMATLASETLLRRQLRVISPNSKDDDDVFIWTNHPC